MKVNDRYCSFYYENDDDYGTIEIEPEKTALLIIDTGILEEDCRGNRGTL